MTQVIARTRDEVYHLWVDALRSGRYRQSQGCLWDEDYHFDARRGRLVDDGQGGGFCCLGVLCDLAVRDGGLPWDHAGGPQRTDGEPPEHFLEFMGLDSDMVGELVCMNDDRNMSFAEIADEIEAVIMPALDIK